MTTPEENFGSPIEIGIRRRWSEVRELENLSSEARSDGNKRCFEGLAWFAGAAASAFLTVYNAVETHQLEHLPPDRVTAAGGLLALASVGISAEKFKKGLKLSNSSVRLHNIARANRYFISYPEQYLD